MLVFSPPPIFSLPGPPPPFPKVKVPYIQTVYVGGLLSCVGDHILQQFNTLFLTRFRTYTIATPPQTKTQEGRGHQTDKHLPRSPFTCQLFQITTFGIAFYQSNLSTDQLIPNLSVMRLPPQNMLGPDTARLACVNTELWAHFPFTYLFTPAKIISILSFQNHN